jgi:signal transduction histidine kinase
MENKDQHRYEVLSLLARAGSNGDSSDRSFRTALDLSAGLVGLDAAALYLWDSNLAVKLNISTASSDEAGERLAFLEKSLFRNLRAESELVSAYMSFGGKQPCHSFTQPLRHGERIFGAVIGLQFGDRTLVSEDVFLETFSAALAVHAIVTGGETVIPRDVLDKERLAAIVETAVTVNHEINNPLTAILGNVQLLLMKRQDLDGDLRTKLEAIEASAGRIKDVTQRLLKMTTPRSVDYAEGTSMIDISDHDHDKPSGPSGSSPRTNPK